MNNSRLLLLLLVTAGLAGWYYTQEGNSLWPSQSDSSPGVTAPPSPQTATAGAGGTAAANPLHDLTAAAVAEIAARPLFNPTRAPKPAPQPVVDTEPQTTDTPPATAEVNPADYELLAVAGGDGGRVAIVRFAPDNRIYHLRQGQYLSDWRVSEIADRAVTLQKNDKSFAIAMFKPTAHAAGTQSSPAAPASDDNQDAGQSDAASPDSGGDGTDPNADTPQP